MQAVNNKGTDQTARMRRLICAFVVRIMYKQVFSWRGSYYIVCGRAFVLLQIWQRKANSSSN